MKSNNYRLEGPPEHDCDSTADRSRTMSLCPVCLERLPARRIPVGDEIHLVKRCPEHGEFRIPVWRGEPRFDQWQRPKIPVPSALLSGRRDKGCPFDCGLCSDHRQRSCTVLIEITRQCDLACPVCYAAAPSRGPDPSAEEIDALFARTRQSAPGCNIQLSGGEPTMRDDLPDIVARGRERGFDFIQINSNGVRLGRDRAYVRALKQAGLASVFLQFDGTGDEIYKHLRGRPLMQAKRAAVAACAQEDIGVVLVPTLVPGVNTDNIGAILQWALERLPVVRGVHFQPVGYFGRYPEPPQAAARITLPEVLQAIEKQSGGLIQAAHMGPPGCENALCSFHGQFMRLAGGKVMALKAAGPADCCSPPSKADQGANRAMSTMARQWAGRPMPPDEAAVHRCGKGAAQKQGEAPDCSQPLSLDEFIHRARTHTFSISAMAFQDAWNMTLDRVRDCCIHVMAADGRLIPFCLYNLTAADGRRLYRQ